MKIMEEENNALFVVRKGDLIGIYKNFSDCQAQVGSSICDPPVSVYKCNALPKEAEDYMHSCGLRNALYTVRAADITEGLFGGSLVPCPLQPPHFATGGPSSDHPTKRRIQEVMDLQNGQPLFSIGDPSSDPPPKRRTHEVMESHNEEEFALTSLSTAPAKRIKLEHLATHALSGDRVCILEFDGACKGNPGQAGAGAVLRTDDGSLICRLREGLGIATNNVAEYRALILGMRYALSKGFTSVRVMGDSKLICMQVQGLWRVRHQNMVKWFEEAKKLKNKFIGFEINHVLRDLNSDADTQANLAIDLSAGCIEEEDFCQNWQNGHHHVNNV